jgi:hypothetical protein
VNQVVLAEDPNRGRPFDHRQALIKWTPNRIVVGQQPRRGAGAEKEVRERIGTVFERARLA